MHPTLLIVNHAADRSRAAQRASTLRALVNDLGGADWRGTEYRAQATEIAAAAGGYSTVVAVGGDGTVHEVVNGLMQIGIERRPRLGIVPAGTGNDFAWACGLPANPAAALERAFKGTERWVDVPLVRANDGRSEYFANTAGLGFDGAINIRTHQITRVSGIAMYTLAVLQAIVQNFETPHCRLRWDGGEVEQRLLMMVVGNGAREGGGFLTTPDARVDDGQLDVLYADPMSRLRMLQFLPKVLRGRHVGEREVHLVRTRRLWLEADQALPIHLDGELFAPYEANVRQVEMEIVPRALRVMV
jgi:YegS/Rv2252/BmrU family lipid kinase